MRLVLVLAALALASAVPAAASSEESTGGATMPPAATGGIAVPGEPVTGAPPAEGAVPAGGTRAGEPAGRSENPATSPPRTRSSAAGAHARPAQDAPPEARPAQATPDDQDVDVRVPIEEGDRERDATQATPSAAPFEGLAPTGMAAAAFAVLAAGAAAAALALRRMAR